VTRLDCRLSAAPWTRRRTPCQGGGTTDDGRSHGAAATGRATAPAPAPSPDDILAGLAWLDGVLSAALATAETIFAVAPGADPHRGLYVADEEARRLLERNPGSPLLHDGADPDGAGLAVLRARFGLSPFDAALVLIALAPDVDLRYERVYGYLQDDVTRRRPTVDLALNLLCADAREKFARRRHVAPDAPLLRSRMLRLVGDPNHVDPPLLAHYLKLEDAVVRRLLGHDALDHRLAGAAEVVADPRPSDVAAQLVDLVRTRRAHDEPLTLYLEGRRGAGRRTRAEALAAALDAPLLVLRLPDVVDEDTSFGELVSLALLEARLRDALPYFAGLEAVLQREDGAAHRQLLSALHDAGTTVVVAGTDAWRARADDTRRPPSLVALDVPMPHVGARRDVWTNAAAAAGACCDRDDLDALAGRFRLTPGQIEDAVALASLEAQRRGAAPDAADLFAAARGQSGDGLASLARKVVPHYRWENIVLPPDRLEQLQEVCDAVRYRAVVYDEWGFDSKLSLGKGINVLFAGPSGTGKTMSAEIIAGQLGLDLYKIDLSTVVSKYIGETEKNLARIFSEAETMSAILFFDEADALFGKRSEVRDSHDRYANLEISYLLQRMEEYEGVVILATNLRKNMDDAFVRRMHFTVEFPFPSREDRLRIWSEIWPRELPRSDALDLAFMADRFELAGGNIRNIALAASYLAAADSRVVTMEHVIQATRREYQKLGVVVKGEEFAGYEA
jgi:Winged helix domain, variant/ATPase family associated with various cellular activities (AAA)